jgi:glutaminyl-peptide cyclotransferase
MTELARCRWVRMRRSRLGEGGRVLCVSALSLSFFFFLGCKSGNPPANASAQAAGSRQNQPFMSTVAGNPPAVAPADMAPPAGKTGGFDGQRAYEQVAKQLSFGPRPAGSPALVQLQNYLESELKSYGCTVDTDSFSADTPAGRLPMKNIVAQIPGEKPGIILLGTHYDTKRIDNFVGADDAGSSTGVMLEIARNLCARKQPEKYAVWIAFFDGEEAVNLQWQDPDNRYGSRQMAAQMAATGDLKKIRVFILADIVGGKNLHLTREANSNKTYAAEIWKVGQGLGYSDVFVSRQVGGVEDDHLSFIARGIPTVDLIDLDFSDVPYWHTPQDTLDKISPKNLAIVGHTLLASVAALQK